MGICHPRVGRGIIWILLDRLLKILDCLLQVFLIASVPKIPTLQIGLVCFWINWTGSRQSLALFWGQLGLDLARDSCCNLVLE